MSTPNIKIPKILYDEAVKNGIDVEEIVLTTIVKALGLDPEMTMRARLELAVKYLGEELIDKDPVQAGEKLYKAAEECVKVLAQYYDLKDILAKVNERGRWTVTDLASAVTVIADRLGKWFEEAWDAANYLHVWGFHEAKLDAELVRRRLPEVERIVNETQKVLTNQA